MGYYADMLGTTRPLWKGAAVQLEALFVREAAAGADLKDWRLRPSGAVLSLATLQESGSAIRNVLTIDRTGNTYLGGTLNVQSSITALGAISGLSAQITSMAPTIGLTESDAAANAGNWTISVDSAVLSIACLNDALAITSTPLSITRAGQVGINTAPSYALDVLGDIRASAATGNAFLRVNGASVSGSGIAGIAFTTNSYSLTSQISANVGSVANLAFATGGTERVRIDGQGMGVGTTAPVYKLHVSGGGASANVVAQSTDASGASVFMGATSSTAGDIGTISTHPLRFFTDSGERMRLTAAGNLGLGTTSPAVKLHISDGTIAHYASYFGSGVVYSGTGSAHAYAAITNNIERMRIDANGLVGIGGTPTASSGKLQVIGVGSPDSSIRVLNTTYGVALRLATSTGVTDAAVIYTEGANALRLGTNNVEQMRIDANGLVGIGGTPGYKFHVQGSGNTALIAATSTDASGAQIFMSANTSSFGDLGTSTAHPLRFAVNSVERARIDTSGNALFLSSVGIGMSTAPTRVGELQQASRALLRTTATATTGTDAISGIEFASWDGSAISAGATFSQSYSLQATDPGAIQLRNIRSASIIFATNNLERMRIDAAGNVGIGRTPSYKLDVNGVGVFNNVGTTFRPAVILEGGGSTAGLSSAALVFSGQNSNAALWSVRYTSFGGDLVFATQSAGTSYADPSESMRLTAAGNLGLGLTPNASWNTAYSVFEVGGSGSAFWGGANNAVMSANLVYTATNPFWNRVATGAATFYQQYQGAHVWYADPSAAAGLFSPTLRMVLSSAGLLGVGGTPTFKFQVFGGGSANVIMSSSTDSGGANAYLQANSTIDGRTGTNTAHPFLIITNAVERARFDTLGNFIHTPPATPPTLTVNGQVTVNLISNTQLRFSARGSDGVTRVANLTLA